MKYEKLPYKDYTIVNNSASLKLSCPDLYRFFILSLTVDKNTRKTDTTLEQLALFVGEKATAYKGGKTKATDSKPAKDKLSFTDRLKASGEVHLEYFRSSSTKGNSSVNRIRYTFNKATVNAYRRIKREFTEIDLPIKIKGYLLKLFALCEPHSCDLKHSKTKIAQLLSMDKTTVEKYNKALIQAGLLVEADKGFQLKVDSFIIDQPKKKLSRRAQEIIAGFTHNITNKKKSGEAFTRAEAIFVKAQKNGFADIVHFDGWTKYLVSGLPNLKKEKRTHYTIYTLNLSTHEETEEVVPVGKYKDDDRDEYYIIL